MARAINHDGASSFATIASSAAKWSLGGAIVGGLVIFGALVLTAGVIASALIPGMNFAAGAGLLLGGSSTLTWTAAIISVLGGGANMGLGALVGGLFGIASGADKVSHEKAAYQSRVRGLTRSRKHQMMKASNDAEINGMMHAYQMLEPQTQQREAMAYQAGQNDLAQHIQKQFMEQQQAQQMHMDPAHAVTASASATCEAKCIGPHTEKYVNEKAAAETQHTLAV